MITERVVDHAPLCDAKERSCDLSSGTPGGSSEFRAFDVDARFEAAMAALAWERFGDGWLRRITCSAEAAEPALAT